MWRRTLGKALLLIPENLSCYRLIPKEGTALYRDWQTGKHDHEVKANVLKSGVPRKLDALLHLRKVVDAPQHFQQCRLGRLHPH